MEMSYVGTGQIEAGFSCDWMSLESGRARIRSFLFLNLRFLFSFFFSFSFFFLENMNHALIFLRKAVAT